MKNNDDITDTDTAEIKQLINRVKQGDLDQADAQLVEKLLNLLLTIVSLLQRKHTAIRRMKELVYRQFGAQQDGRRPPAPRRRRRLRGLQRRRDGQFRAPGSDSGDERDRH